MINYAITIYKQEQNFNNTKMTSNIVMPFNILFRESTCVFLKGKIGDVEDVTNVFDCVEEGNKIILILKKLKAKHIDEYQVNLSTEEISRVSYDKSTSVYEGDAESLEIIQGLDAVSLGNIFLYLNELASIKPAISEYISNIANRFILITDLMYARGSGSVILKNLLCLLQNNSLEVEKLINSNNQKVLTKNLKIEGFRLNAAKKLSKTIGLPPFAMPLIKTVRIESCIDSLNKLNEIIDGNDLRTLLELFENSRNFLIISKTGNTPEARENKIKKFIDNLLYVLSPERTNKYKFQDVLNYVLRQAMYWSISNTFDFPFEEMILFTDYITICEQNNLTYDKYPQNIRKIHDVVLINISSLTDVKEEDFKKATDKYKLYEMELKDGYSFIVPESIHSLIQEGNDLHHCIGSYAERIAKEKSIILFMRKTTEIDVSFVTIEINSKCEIIEIKGIYNEDPEPEIIKVANKWAGICKRLSGK